MSGSHTVGRKSPAWHHVGTRWIVERKQLPGAAWNTSQSYYPLYPPPEDMMVDYEHFYPYASLPVTPDLLITPSDLKYFVKDVLGCVCINPSRLTKGQVGGSYAQLWVQPQVSGAQRKSPCIAAQVIKI